jgi:hypothetical protein
MPNQVTARICGADGLRDKEPADRLCPSSLGMTCRNSPSAALGPWFTPADVACIMAPDRRVGPLTDCQRADIADGLNFAAQKLLVRLIHDRDHPRRGELVASLDRLVSAASSLGQRLKGGKAAVRQAKAVCEAVSGLPPVGLLGVCDAAAGSDALSVGEVQLIAAVRAIEAFRATAGPAAAQSAAAAAALIAEWARLAAGARPEVHQEREGAAFAVRIFAITVLEILKSTAEAQPVLGRRTETQTDPGSPTGPSIDALAICFARLRAACLRHNAVRQLADHPLLSPGSETCLEWVRTAQGKPRRFRRPRSARSNLTGTVKVARGSSRIRRAKSTTAGGSAPVP